MGVVRKKATPAVAAGEQPVDQVVAASASADEQAEQPVEMTPADRLAARLVSEVGAVKSIISTHIVGSDARHLREHIASIGMLSAQLGQDEAGRVIDGIFAKK